MNNLFKVSGIIILLLGALTFLSIRFSNAEGNPLVEFFLKLTEKEIRLGKVQEIDKKACQIEFALPAERRSWPLYIKEDFLLQDNSFEDVSIELSIVNDSSKEIQISIREVETNNVQRVVLMQGDKCTLFKGKFKTFIFNFKKGNLLRDNGNDIYSEWNPLVSISSSSGERIKGKLKFTSSDMINLIEPMIMYTYLPSDTF